MPPSPPPKSSVDSSGSAHGPDEHTTARLGGSAVRFRLGSRRASQPADDGLRRSIQFDIGGSDTHLPHRSGSLKSQAPTKTHGQEKRIPGRAASPPPPSTYQRGVSFDTFDNRDATDYSLTLNYKHRGYQSTRRSRTFLCGTDQNDYSNFALEWLIDELVDDGDEIVCLRVVEKDSKIASEASIEGGKYRQEAEKLFEQVIQKNSQDEKAISLVMELAVGKVQEIIQRMIQIYEPAVLIVGTRGRNLNGMQGLLPGSVSKYCLQQSPIPVIVVRPSTKREKKKKKRLADPSRRSYNHILEMSEKRGNRLFGAKTSAESSVIQLPDAEAAAVAKAVGLPSAYAGREHSHGDSKETLSSKNSDYDDRSTSTHSLELPRPESPNAVVLKSPMLGNLDSPSVTESESENDAETTVPSGDKKEASSNGDSTEDVVFSREPDSSETAITELEKAETSPTASLEQLDTVPTQPEEAALSIAIVQGEGHDEDSANAESADSGTVTPRALESAEAPPPHENASVTTPTVSPAAATEDTHKEDTEETKDA